MIRFIQVLVERTPGPNPVHSVYCIFCGNLRMYDINALFHVLALSGV